ncbi:MAG: chorismate-binding protein [Oligoflexia bacterium]|nr:chorismate-binding protein [Oligoflexia bacterium]
MKQFLSSGAMLVSRSARSEISKVRIAWGDWTWSASPRADAVSFFAPDFFLSESLCWASPSQWAELTVRELREALAVFAEHHGETARFSWQGPDEGAFRKGFEELQEAFRSGSLTKAVPVVFERASGQLSPAVLASLIASLLERSGPARVYGIWNEHGGMLGATPEDLFEVTRGGVLKTMALAGTYRKVTGKESSAILDDPKERREHQLVVDDIRAALTELGEVQVGETGVLELPTLIHLKTPIEARLSRAVPFEKLVRALHPTAALGAFPRKPGWDWLRSQESARERGRFGAPFGLLWPSGAEVAEASCVVAIRNIQWDADELRLGSGCGLISESVLEREWDELALKRESVKRMMGLA